MDTFNKQKNDESQKRQITCHDDDQNQVADSIDNMWNDFIDEVCELVEGMPEVKHKKVSS